MEDFLANQKNLEPVDIIRNLVVDGNLTVNNTKNVAKINGIPFENLVDKVIKTTILENSLIAPTFRQNKISVSQVGYRWISDSLEV